MYQHDNGRKPATDRTSATAPKRGELRRLGIVATIAATVSLMLIGATSALSASGGIDMTTTSSGDGGGKIAAKYARMWDELSRKNKRWARSTSKCESGGNARIHGGGGAYHGAFQFMLSTWRAAPRSPGGDPHHFSWKTQAVVAVYLKKRDGAGHWPVCG